MLSVKDKVVNKFQALWFDQRGEMVSGVKLVIYGLLFIILILIIIIAMAIKYYLEF